MLSPETMLYGLLSVHAQLFSRGVDVSGEALPAGPKIIFITVQQGLADVYRLANLFVTASEIETQGIVLLEAAASGLPIAAVRATCIPEIVHHEENGFLCTPGNLDELSRSMTILIQNKTMAKQMGAMSRCLAQPHDRRITLEAHETLYRELTLATPVRDAIKYPGAHLARREVEM
ncbi:MAG: D-inositol-3-phosphate glycosyltransferase [Anaerolineales bacterium]|nr:D-inositol-3-phosphate glycosyltransferase [Anaerolineales bacterium]